MYVDVCYDSYVIYELVVHMHTTRTSTRVVLILEYELVLVVLARVLCILLSTVCIL